MTRKMILASGGGVILDQPRLSAGSRKNRSVEIEGAADLSLELPPHQAARGNFRRR